MLRQVFTHDPVTGRSRHEYIDQGPRAAVPGHARPVRAILGGHGAQQLRLPAVTAAPRRGGAA